MGLLHKRPLALFCTCFLAALYAASYLFSHIKIFFVIACAGLALFWTILILGSKKRRMLWITLLLCTLSVMLAFLHMHLRIDKRAEGALALTGSRTVECQILSEEWVGDGHSEYVAELLSVGEESVRIRTYLICGFSGNFHPGDRFVGRVELLEPDQRTYGVRAEDRVDDSRILLLTTVLHDAADGALVSCAKDIKGLSLLLQPNGMEILSDRIRLATADAFDRSLGDEISPLARSFFIGDRSDLSARTVRDFKRTGTSHLLAVSGLHIAVLLGGLEWILRKLTLSKRIRIATVSAAALLLLMMTGFSMSACRSVLMLFAVYLNYLFARENDGLTSLLVAVSLILLLSADAFFDLGLWMSFSATLGLLSVYPLLSAAFPCPKPRSLVAKIGLRIGRGAWMIALMSTVTGLFLLPIQWSVFGELSLVAVPANLAVSFLGTVFLYVIPLALLLSPIPILGLLTRGCLTALGRLITTIIGFFSQQNFAMISLRYVFAEIIIPMLALCMLILLLVRLRHKWILVLPPILATICFAACLFVTYQREAPMVSDYTNGNQRFLAVVENGEAILCDISCHQSTAYFDAARLLRAQGATDIDSLIIGHMSENLPQLLEEFLPYTVVHRVYLSRALATAYPAVAKETACVAGAAGVEVLFYEDGEAFSALKNSFSFVDTGAEGALVSLCLDFDGQYLTYIDPVSMTEETEKISLSQLAKSHTAWISVSECDGTRTIDLFVDSSTLKQILIDQPHDTHACVALDAAETSVYRYPKDRKKRTVIFSMSS